MTSQLHAPGGAFRFRALLALVLGLVLVAGPLGGLAPALGVPAGYVATGEDASVLNSSGGSGTLPLMTAGVPYSGTITGPQYGGSTDWCWSVLGDLPGDVEPSIDECSPSLTFSGTPEAGDFFIEVEFSDTAGEMSYFVYYSGTVESGKTPTVTTITVPAVSPYGAIPLSATVVGDSAGETPPTGTVEFYASGTVLIGTATLVEGVATTDGVVDKTNAGGSPGITAKYLGDDEYEPSTSTAKTTLVYVPAAAGEVWWNGTPVEDVTVDLVATGDPTVVVDSDLTDADGRFTVSPGSITSSTDVNSTYLLRATFEDGAVLFHRFGGNNVTDVAMASSTTPGSWKNYLEITRRTAPVWTDSTLATPRVDSAYSDAVAATAFGGDIYYWVSEGSLPNGLTLDDSTGAVTGTPEECEVDDDETPFPFFTTTTAAPSGCEYDFEITASGNGGSVTQRFTGTVKPAGPDAEPELGLHLDFAAGTSIDDASSTISAEGLQVGSTYTLTMFSTPRVLYTGTVGASGGFTWVVALPADTPVGPHRLVLTGIAADGTPMSAQAWFSLRADGRIGAVSYVGPVGVLAATGAEPNGALAASGILLLAGAVALTAGRLRTRATRA